MATRQRFTVATDSECLEALQKWADKFGVSRNLFTCIVLRRACGLTDHPIIDKEESIPLWFADQWSDED